MEIMTNVEDKQFLAMQRMDVTSSNMAGVDRRLLEKETRKRARVRKPMTGESTRGGQVTAAGSTW